MKIVDIKGFESIYKITDTGKVFSIKSNRFIGSNLKDGYSLVILRKNNKSYAKTIHRIVALHFLPNPNFFPEVNHIDGNKHNNNINNLEWVTPSENVQHAFDTGLANNKNLAISKRQISCEIVKQIRERYIPRDSKHGTRAMAREFGIAQYTVSQIIRGLRRTKYETA